MAGMLFIGIIPPIMLGMPVMPIMPVMGVMGIMFIGTLLIGIPIIEPLIGMAFMESSSLELFD
jgi:hypothetical protein